MDQQLSFSDAAYTSKKKTTRKERFLCEMDAVLPWADLLQPILRHYPKPGHGRRPIPAATMLRIYFMQQWYGLSDPAMEDSLYDVASMRRFAGVGLDAIPDETTICTFRHFLERHALTEVLFERTGAYLSERVCSSMPVRLWMRRLWRPRPRRRIGHGRAIRRWVRLRKGRRGILVSRRMWVVIRKDGFTPWW